MVTAPISIIRQIVRDSLYATIATVDEGGKPWNSPVFVCNDSGLTFYWASAVTAQHSRNIAANGRAFLVLFDSHDAWGEGRGVYVVAQAQVVTDEAEITKACELRRQKVAKATQAATDFSGNSPRRIYKAIPQEIWVNDVEITDGKVVDVKSKVDLLQLRNA